jgi:hypothetical protein
VRLICWCEFRSIERIFGFDCGFVVFVEQIRLQVASYDCQLSQIKFNGILNIIPERNKSDNQEDIWPWAGVTLA